MDDILGYITVFGIGLGALMGLGQLIVENKTERNWLIAALYLCLSALIFNGWSVATGIIYDLPFLFGSELPFVYLIGPVMYLIIVQLTDENFEFHRQQLVHFVPAVLVTPIAVYNMAYHAGAPDRLRAELGNFDFGLAEALFTCGLLVVIFYAFLMVRKGRLLLSATNLRHHFSSWILLLLVIGSVSVVVSVVIPIVTRNISFLSISTSLMTLGLCTSHLIGQRKPELVQNLQRVVMKEKYKRTLLGGLDVDGLASRLKGLMAEEQLYTNDRLSIKDVAEELDLSVHQLSELLNVKLRMNFATFVNSYRVARAKEMLLADREQTILTIAYQVGFNSKSAFNRAFMRVANASPSEFRAAN